MTAFKLVLLTTVFGVAGANLACRKEAHPEAPGLPRAPLAGDPGHRGSPGVKTKSDLDRPVEELVKLTCEHGKRTYECDECRYETGFVRVPASLIAGGLLKTTKAERQKIAVPIALTGEVSFDERRIGHVSTQVEGIIKRVHVALGDHVRRDQPLLEIESVTVGEDRKSVV